MTGARDLVRQVMVAASLVAGALVIGKLSAERPGTALRLVLLPLVVLAVVAPAIPLILGVAALPYQGDVLGAAGQLVSASDVLLVLGLGGVALAALTGDRFNVRPLAPVAAAVVVYFFAITVAWANLPTTSGAVVIAQRLELVVGALVAGAYLAHRELLDRALLYYVLAAAVLAAVAILVTFAQGSTAEDYLGVQKNPAGQAIANALLITLFQRRIPARLPVGALLALGLIASQSRGALLATIVAFALAAALTSSNRRVQSLAVIPLLLGVFYGGFSALPSAQQERLIGTAPGGDVATETRQSYADDAVAKIKSAPVLGTGLGLYEAGEKNDQTYTIDPHNVLLLEAAEGGGVLVGGFGILTLGSFIVLVLRRRRHQLVIVALAVQTSTVLHGVVDVYWVRGTPVLGWLLVGAALFLAAKPDESNAEAEPDEKTTKRPVIAGGRL